MIQICFSGNFAKENFIFPIVFATHPTGLTEVKAYFPCDEFATESFLDGRPAPLNQEQLETKFHQIYLAVSFFLFVEVLSRFLIYRKKSSEA